MHLHGHKFWLLGSGEGKFPYRTVGDMPSTMLNLQNPPYRDTIDLPASGWAVIRYGARVMVYRRLSMTDAFQICH